MGTGELLLCDIFQQKNSSVTFASILIPVYCEARNIRHLIARLNSVHWPVQTEWIFIDDASTDDSVAIIKSFQSQYPQIRLRELKKNRGKGFAIRAGIRLAMGDIIAIQDADHEYDPNDLVRLMKPIINGKADVVFGTRFGKGSRQVHRTYHRLGNLALTWFSNICSNLHVSDMEVCYKVFRSDIIKSFSLKSDRFGFEPEVTAYLAKFNIRTLEFPIQYFPRNYLNGKKIGWKDGVAAIWSVLRFNLFKSRLSCLTTEAKTQFLGQKGLGSVEHSQNSPQQSFSR